MGGGQDVRRGAGLGKGEAGRSWPEDAVESRRAELRGRGRVAQYGVQYKVNQRKVDTTPGESPWGRHKGRRTQVEGQTRAKLRTANLLRLLVAYPYHLILVCIGFLICGIGVMLPCAWDVY